MPAEFRRGCLNALELDLQATVNPDVGSRDPTLVLCKHSEVLVTSARAPQPLQNLVCGFSGYVRKGRKSNNLLRIVKL